MFKKFSELISSSSYTLRERMFILSGIIGTIAMIAAFVASFFSSGTSVVESLAPFFGAFFIAFVTYISIKKRSIELGSAIITIVSVCIVLPYGFLKGGGVYSGSPTWFVTGFVIVFLLFSHGKKFYFYYFLTVISFGLTIYMSYKYPGLVSPLESKEAIYYDQFIAPLLVATIVGTLQHQQSVILDKEIKISDKQHKEIEELNEAQNRFFSSMSHEIRTPINTIIGLNETTLRQKDLPEDVVENSLNIQNASRMLLSLINDILDLSKISSGKMELSEAQYETSRMFSEIVNLLWNRAREKGLQLNINIGENIPSMLYGDEMRIKQIIVNLLTNAIKYTQEGSVTLTVDGEKRATNEFDLRVSVADTGQGIRKESIPYIFDSFKRVESSENKAIEGTGLGLSITKQLIDLMNGQITVDSIYTKGSTFKVNIPQKIVSETPINFRNISDLNRDLEHYQQAFEAPEARILIVDDNDMNRMVCQKLLRETKVKTDAVGSGRECLELTLKNHYDVIFMDHEMPDMDGIETLRRLRNQANGLCHESPVVALTANAGSDRNSFYIDHGFQAYLAKPIHGSLLEATILQLLPPELIENIKTNNDEDIIQVSQNLSRREVIIATDSSCDLPDETIEEYDIRIIPNYILTREGRFRDNEEIDANNLYRYLKEENQEVRTEPSSVDEFELFFGSLLTEAETIIFIPTTPLLSKSYKNALKAAESFNNVKVMDVGSLSVGLGMLTIKAEQLANKGRKADEIIDEVKKYEESIVANFLVPSVEMISRRHNLSLITKIFVKAFNFEVCFSVTRDRIKLRRFFIAYLNEAIIQYIRFNFRNKKNINTDKLYIVYSGYSNDERQAIVNEIEKYIKFNEIIIEKSSAVLSANSGSRYIGFSYEKKIEKEEEKT